MHELYKPTEERIRIQKEMDRFFPLVLFFWRKKPGKQRKMKKAKSRDMNNYSIITYLCTSANMFISCRRNANHKGYPFLVAAMHFREDHQAVCDISNRVIMQKFKNWEEVRLIEHRQHDDFPTLIQQLKSNYPCTATGQTRMF